MLHNIKRLYRNCMDATTDIVWVQHEMSIDKNIN